MTYPIYSQVRLDTGELTGIQIQGDPHILELNTPAGCAWVAGAHDPRRFTVALVVDDFGGQVMTVVERVPPRPADDDYRTWAWDAAAGDWVASSTVLLRAAEARAERDRRMLASDWVTLRALRTGQPIPAEWASYMQALADVPQQSGFPDAIDWPEPPAG